MQPMFAKPAKCLAIPTCAKGVNMVLIAPDEAGFFCCFFVIVFFFFFFGGGGEVSTEKY